jgi:hypothetical protein
VRVKTIEEPQGLNLMVSRHGASTNPLQKCAECRHLIRVEGYPEYCDQFVLPSGYHMPWAADNRACGMFEERVKEES